MLLSFCENQWTLLEAVCLFVLNTLQCVPTRPPFSEVLGPLLVKKPLFFHIHRAQKHFWTIFYEVQLFPCPFLPFEKESCCSPPAMLLVKCSWMRFPQKICLFLEELQLLYFSGLCSVVSQLSIRPQVCLFLAERYPVQFSSRMYPVWAHGTLPWVCLYLQICSCIFPLSRWAFAAVTKPCVLGPRVPSVRLGISLWDQQRQLASTKPPSSNHLFPF